MGAPGAKNVVVRTGKSPSAFDRKRPRDEIAGVVIRRRTQLCRRVIAMIEQIVDLHEQLHSLLHLIMRSEVHHAIAGREPRSQIVTYRLVDPNCFRCPRAKDRPTASKSRSIEIFEVG